MTNRHRRRHCNRHFLIDHQHHHNSHRHRHLVHLPEFRLRHQHLMYQHHQHHQNHLLKLHHRYLNRRRRRQFHIKEMFLQCMIQRFRLNILYQIHHLLQMEIHMNYLHHQRHQIQKIYFHFRLSIQ